LREVKAHANPPPTGAEAARPRTIPPIHLLGAALFEVCAALALPRLSYPGALPVALGAAAFVAGAWLMMRTRNLMRARGTTHRFDPTACVVEDDVFARSRNPMYLGMTAILGGAALALRNYAALAAPLYFFLVIDRVFVPFEEAKLEREIGPPYLAYKARVRRWL